MRLSFDHFLPLSSCFALALAAGVAAQVPLNSGDLVVVRVGDGSAALGSAATPVFVEEMTTAGSAVQTIALPTTASGSNHAFTNSGSATSEAYLNLSVNGEYLTLAGYDAAVGTASVVGTASATNPRVVARIDLNGVVDTSTALTDAYSGNNIRSVASDDGSQFWTGGTSSTSGGVRYATYGGTTSTQLSTSVTNTRVVGIANGQLYVSSASGAFQGMCAVGTGLPTTSGQTIAVLPGFPTATGPSNYDFFFADGNTLYVTDDRSNGSGGIQKWTSDGTTWTLAYTLAPATNVGCRGLSGVVSGGVATLYATTAVASANSVVAVTDTGAGATFATLATAATNTVYRGLRLLPERGSFSRLPHGCGPTTIDVGGNARPGGIVSTSLGAVTGQPVIGIGFSLLGLPFCGCTIGHDYLITVFAANFPLPIPSNPQLIGLPFYVQGVDVFGTGGCASPLLTLTDTIVVTIG